MKTAVCVKPVTAVRGEEEYPIQDEICMGWAVGIISESEKEYRIVTHYGYEGYIDKDTVTFTDLNDRDGLSVVTFPLCDVMLEPDVESRILLTLPAGSFVRIINSENNNGYYTVLAADGTRGFMPAIALQPRKDSDGFLISEDPDFFVRQSVKDEKAFREEVVRNCQLFQKVQYRWGGKCGTGIDCSGLAFMGYMLSGILIYRDADIKYNYPLRELPVSYIEKGDLIFFPGHVAIYLGDGRYIHSTANEKAFGITVNSLNREDEDYRDDLAKSITRCGTLFYY